MAFARILPAFCLACHTSLSCLPPTGAYREHHRVLKKYCTYFEEYTFNEQQLLVMSMVIGIVKDNIDSLRAPRSTRCQRAPPTPRLVFQAHQVHHNCHSACHLPSIVLQSDLDSRGWKRDHPLSEWGRANAEIR